VVSAKKQLEPWSASRIELPVGPLFCVINGATRGRAWSAAAARTWLRRPATAASVRLPVRTASDGSRPRGPDVRKGVRLTYPASACPQQSGHHVDLPARYNAEIVETVHGRRAPMVGSTRRFDSERAHLWCNCVLRLGAACSGWALRAPNRSNALTRLAVTATLALVVVCRWEA
jgi:integrase/recombinase XerD